MRIRTRSPFKRTCVHHLDSPFGSGSSGGRSWEEWFEHLYRDFRATVWREALRIVICEADADDVTQRVFHRIWKRGPSIRRLKLSSAYFTRAGRNEAIVFLRDKRRRESLATTATTIYPYHEPGPERTSEPPDLHERLSAMIQRLPERCACVMTLLLAGVPRCAIPRQLGITAGAVEKQITRGYRLLREIASDGEWDPPELVDASCERRDGLSPPPSPPARAINGLR